LVVMVRSLWTPVQNFIIDGSPRWELYRTCPVYAGMEGSSTAATAILKAWGASTSTSIPSKSDEKTTVPQVDTFPQH